MPAREPIPITTRACLLLEQQLALGNTTDIGSAFDFDLWSQSADVFRLHALVTDVNLSMQQDIRYDRYF